MVKKREREGIVLLVLVIAGALLFLGATGRLGSFTFEGLQPQTTTQNGLTFTLSQRDFLSVQNIAGQCHAVSGPTTFCGGPQFNASIVRDPASGADLGVFLNETKIGSLPFTDGSFSGGSLPGAPGASGRIFCAQWYTEGTNSCGNPRLLIDPRPFSFPIPQQFKESGGQFDVRVRMTYTNGQPSEDLLATTLYIEPAKCSDPSYVTYEEVFRSGATLRVSPQSANETGFRHPSPVFCHSAPLLKQQEGSDQVFDQSTDEYDSLSNGGFVTVPNGQQWVFFYRAPANVSGAVDCQAQGGVWNASASQCELPPTLVYVCNGVQQQDATCVTQSNDFACQNPNAVRVQQPDGSYICRIFEPTSCPANAVLKTDALGNEFCEFEPVCPGQVVNGVCTQEVAPVDGPVNGLGVATIVLIVLLAGGVVWWFILRKR